MQKERPGIAFEKIVADIQARIDPAASVSHNEMIRDRLGHNRQFDVVIRGNFAGQPMLGIIECKDFKRRVGTPEVDAFITKSRDVKANIQIIVSRAGFTKQALEKCAHYNIQPLSLIESDPENRKFFIGTIWTADVFKWSQFSIIIHLPPNEPSPGPFNVQDVRIKGKRAIDWLLNYLEDNHATYKGTGWLVDIVLEFDLPQLVEIRPHEAYPCKAIQFKAERTCRQLERVVGINGEGFLDWNAEKAIFPGGSEISTDHVPTDFSQWSPRSDQSLKENGFIRVHMEVVERFPRIQDALDLMCL